MTRDNPELPPDARYWARQVATGALKRHPLSALDATIDEIAVRAEYGDPCDDYDAECVVCAAWSRHQSKWS